MPNDVRASSRQAAGHTLLVFTGNLTATALGFLANILVIRALGPDGFGVVIVATVFLTVLWQVTGRGLDQALVRCVATFGREDQGRVPAACQTVHQIKLVLGGGLVLVGVVLAVPLTHFFVGRDVSAAPLAVAALGALTASLWGYTGASLQAARAFARYTFVQVANAIVRLVLTVALFAMGIMTPVLALVAVTTGYAGGAACGYLLAPAAVRGLHGRADLRPTIYRYSRWLVISSIVYLLYTRQDQLLLARLAGAETAGVYGAAITFIQLVDLLTASLLTVFLPRVCEQSDRGGLRRQVRTSLWVSAALAVPAIALLFVARPAMSSLLGPRFGPSIPIFTIIFPGAVFNMLTHPLQAVLHTRGKTHLLTGLDVLVVCANGVANYSVIPTYGALGAAVVALATRVLSGVLLAVLVLRELYQHEPAPGVRGSDGAPATP